MKHSTAPGLTPRIFSKEMGFECITLTNPPLPAAAMTSFFVSTGSQPGVTCTATSFRCSDDTDAWSSRTTWASKSETPSDRRYTIEEHCENLDRLVTELDLKNLTLVLQDWGGPIGSAIAYRHPERVKRMCVMDAIVGGRAPNNNIRNESAWFKWVKIPPHLNRRCAVCLPLCWPS